jgi:hypothetical protein
MQDDPAIASIREVRHHISKQFDHDPKRFVEYYIRLQERHKDRLLDGARDEDSEEPAAQAEPPTAADGGGDGGE